MGSGSREQPTKETHWNASEGAWPTYGSRTELVWTETT